MQSLDALELPTLGEVFKVVFELTGLLANKHKQSQVIGGDKRKKTIQTQLRRLASGEGDPDSLYNELREQLHLLLSEAIAHQNVVDTALATLDSGYEGIRKTLKEQHTYLTKSETAKWLIECGIVDGLINDVHKNSLFNDLPYSRLRFPSEEEWWLPCFINSKRQWPLERTWRWVYQQLDTSQTRFHCPDGESQRGKQNLENASRWFNRERLPSWSELQKNFRYSVQLLERCEDNKYHREISPELQKGLETVLFFARLATAAWMKLEKQFEETFTRYLAIRMNSQNRRLKKEVARLHAMNEELIQKLPPMPEYARREILRKNVDFFWRLRSDTVLGNATRFQREVVNKRDTFYFTLSELKLIIKRYDKFTLSMMLTRLKYQPTKEQINYAILYKEGRDLLLSDSLSFAQISNFEQLIKANNNEDNLSWLVLWMRGELNAQEQKFDAAFTFYDQAFEDAKTRAASELYLFANKFADVCAKANKWSRFKRLVAWTSHTDIEIRILRNFEISEENIRGTFELLKRITYAN